MPQLGQAGLFARIVSSVFPKKMEVELQTETLPDGNLQVVPVYTVGGRVVPGEFVSGSARQTILGHSVALGEDALLVHRETRGNSQRLSKKNAAGFLGQMAASGVRLRTRGKATPPVVSVVRPELKLDLGEDDALRVSAQLVTPNGIVVDKPTSLEDLRQNDGWFIAGDDLYRVEGPHGPADAAVFTGSEPVVFNGDDVPRFLAHAQEHAKQFAGVEQNSRLAGLAIYGEQPESRLNVDGDSRSIQVEPALVFRGKGGALHQPSAEAVRDAAAREEGGFVRVPEGWIHIKPEVAAAHESAVNELRSRLGPLDNIRGQAIPRTLTTVVDRKNLSSPWAVYFSSEVKNSHRIVSAPADARFSLNVVDADGNALLQLDPRYHHERFRLSHAEVAEVVANDGEWVRRDNAWVKVDQQRFGEVAQAIDRVGPQATATKDGVRFPASERERVIEIFSRLGSIEHGESYADFLAKLADFEKIDEVPLPASLRANIALREYQQHGYNWLSFLRKFGLNGILADDMGLGKTLQTLAAIRREQERKQSSLPSLVICPTSVVANWKLEAAKFFDGIEVCIYAGSGRARVLRAFGLDGDGGAHSADAATSANGDKPDTSNLLVITSFGVALRDQEKLSRIPWLYVVVDEAHQIKNPSAKRTRAIKTINGQHKLALTGTPIQNNLEELWSLFDFVMPGYLETRTRFRERYGKGNRVDWKAVRNERYGLRKRVHPFVLRRLKENVAKDLPEKVLIQKPVELTPVQVKLYKETLASREFKDLLNVVEAKGVRRASTEILAIYSRLRTICNHPALAGPHANGAPPSGPPAKGPTASEPAASAQSTSGPAASAPSTSGPAASAPIRAKDSGKLEALKDLMAEVTTGKHRALIFCQSTRMLDLIQECFKEWGVKHLRLDGSTPGADRQELVDRFNRDVSLTAFLISTRAGGLGLNLTGADTVIFYDHDWNPANDNQAQDRAYRIGQTRTVTVYKLISVGTIEEKIIERQQLKQTLADEVIGSDEEGFKDLTKDQLLSLFEFRETADQRAVR
jgi:superfamily II DNA or RNA helicase